MDDAGGAQHTPGPWTYRYDPATGYGRFEMTAASPPKRDPVVFAIREDWVGYMDRSPEGRANARLIAAAPEMLEALRECHRELSELREQERYDGLGTIDRARAAIAKAEV